LSRLGGILGGVFYDLVFPSPVAVGTLPPWYQPPSPPFTSLPNPVGSYTLDPLKIYVVSAFGSIKSPSGTSILTAGVQTFEVSNVKMILEPEFERQGQRQRYVVPIVYQNNFTERRAIEHSIITSELWVGNYASLLVREKQSVTPLVPASPLIPSPAPPYALNVNISISPLSPPKTKTPLTPFPTTSPNPFRNPAPGFTPLPGANPNPNPNNSEDNPPFPFPPFAPFPVTPGEKPLTRYATNDPVLSLSKKPSGSTTTNPNNPTPLPDFSLTPNSNAPNPNPNPNAPNPNPNPNAPNPNPTPFPPGFVPFGQLDPKDPVITPKEEKKAPIIQTPPGSNCCVPTPVTDSLGDINQKSDLLLEKMIDLSLLQVINGKLGPQVSGGLSGFLTQKFSALWNSRVIDRALNLMAVGASLHNAIMLSRDLGATLIETTSNVLAAVGIKDADGNAFNFNAIIGESVENFVKSSVGTENYNQLKQTWVKANRILTAGANLIDSVRSMQHTIIEAQEVVGGWVAKIGNGLTQDGVVNDDTIDWMPERPDFKNPFFRAQQTIEDLTEATESVNQLASAVIETQELTAQIATNYEAFKNEIETKSVEKKNQESGKKGESASPDIGRSNLKEGTPNDGD
jgi:hypothetical protein